jgi:quinoprotein glucose dehydrogenase
VISFLKLPVGPEGIPAVYEVGGREYIAISARPEVSHGDLPTPEADSAQKALQGYYVFALPAKPSTTKARQF